jgi:hypothetical protein
MSNKGNMNLPKDHNSSLTKSKHIKIDEMPDKELERLI